MSSSRPLQESDIIFSSFASSIKTTLSELKRTNLSIKNRLRSIKQDSEYVGKVADAYGLPLVANERCGSWYIPPDQKAGSAYFKSTDGHFGQWAFSLRRLNLQLLDVVGKAGGCIIVDSTRRGKVMPDALAKTVPIWINVMNRLLFPEYIAGSIVRLSVPLYAVSESEYAQIAARLENFLQQAKALGLDVDSLRGKLNGKPMKVTWVKPDEILPDTSPTDDKRNLIVLCTASNQTSHETSTNSDYVQGAADDPESWSLGLDASMFWRHAEQLLSTSEDDLPELINTIVKKESVATVIRNPTLIRPTTNIFIANNVMAEIADEGFNVIVSCTKEPNNTLSERLKHRYIVLQCSTGKIGSRQLRKELEVVKDKLAIHPPDRILVTCETGKDLSVGLALSLLCMFYDENAMMINVTPPSDNSAKQHHQSINKTLIKQRLSWIMASMPDASPSRATLQSVNAFLMG